MKIRSKAVLVIAIAILGVACSNGKKKTPGGPDAGNANGAVDGSLHGSDGGLGDGADGLLDAGSDLAREAAVRLDGQGDAKNEGEDASQVSPDAADPTFLLDADVDAAAASPTDVAHQTDDAGDAGGSADQGTAPGCVNGCLIGGLCYPAGVYNPGNPCLVCDTGRSTSAWSNNDGATCDDGKFCTVGDRCSAGVCSGSARNCSDGIACNGTETCDEASDACLAGSSTCGTGSVCSASSGACVAFSTCPGCVISGTCYGEGQTNPGNQCQKCARATSASAWTTSVGATCNDGKFCTVGDTCSSAGACTGTTRSCDDGVACNGTETCDGTTDKCLAGTPTCAGNTICDVTAKQCVATCTGCVIGGTCYGSGQTNPGNPCEECPQGASSTAWSKKQNGASCDDRVFCNGVDTCSNGTCGHGSSPCGGGTSCVEDKKACFMVGVPLCNADGDVIQYDTNGESTRLHDCVASSAHGTCVAGVCGCDEGYSGADCQSQPPGCVVRVSTSGNDANDGSTWALAVATVQQGLTLAAEKLGTSVPSCEVWVASGIYKPTSGTNRSATFQLKASVGLYGGFAGTEVRRSQRDIEANPTVLSGDIGAPGDQSDNSYHVVTGVTGGTIDGFTITAGSASGADPNDRGGGMYNDHASSTVTNCTFSGNSAAGQGGGMYNEYSPLTVTNCTFSGNSAVQGGGMYNEHSPLTVTNCTFSGNSAVQGGGMFNNISSPTVTNCTFSGNSASYAGNPAASGGGGMFNMNNSSPTVTNCTFSGNSTSFVGGGMFNLMAFPSVTNTTFSGNFADTAGGAMYIETALATVVNSIFWGDHVSNTAPSSTSEFYLGSNGHLNVSYSIVQGGYAGAGNIDQDPLLSLNDLHPLAGSPAIDHGTGCVSSVLATDQEGKQRWDMASVTNATGTSGVDIGAYEYQGQVSNGDTLVTPLCQVPTVTTAAATSLGTSSAVLNGSGIPNGQATTGWFRISTTNPGSCNDSFGTRVPATDGTAVGTGTSAVPYAITATGLTAGTPYYFCAIVSNSAGGGLGSVLSFTTSTH